MLIPPGAVAIADAMESVTNTRKLLNDARKFKQSAEKKNCLMKVLAIAVPLVILGMIAYFIFDAVMSHS